MFTTGRVTNSLSRTISRSQPESTLLAFRVAKCNPHLSGIRTSFRKCNPHQNICRDMGMALSCSRHHWRLPSSKSSHCHKTDHVSKMGQNLATQCYSHPLLLRGHEAMRASMHTPVTHEMTRAIAIKRAGMTVRVHQCRRRLTVMIWSAVCLAHTMNTQNLPFEPATVVPFFLEIGSRTSL